MNQLKYHELVEVSDKSQVTQEVFNILSGSITQKETIEFRLWLQIIKDRIQHGK